MILDERLASFVEWCAAYQLRIADYLDAGLVAPDMIASPEAPRLPVARAAMTPVPDAITTLLDSARHAMTLHRSTKPELARLRNHIQQLAADLATTPRLGTFVAELSERVEALPGEIDVEPTRLDMLRAKGSTAVVPLRRWLELAVIEPISEILDRLDLDANAAVTVALEELDRLDKVTDYYALAVQRHSPELGDGHRVGEFAAAGLERAHALLDAYRDARRRDAKRLRAQCVREVSAAIERALGPLRSHRPAELARQLRVLEERARDRARPPSLSRRVARSVRGAWSSTRPWLDELRADLRRTLADRQSDEVEARWNDILRRTPSAPDADRLPVGYTRLFTALPFELADVYHPRPDLERLCLGAIRAWLEGDPRSILIDGDRGSGKRTLVNQVLSEVRRRADVHWLRLGHALCDEPGVVEAVARELELDASLRTFDGLASALREATTRVIVVVENSERVFVRTPDGVARARAFFELVARSAPHTLWVLLMATPAADLLDTVLDLRRRVTDRVRVEPLDGPATRSLILARHELSGHDLEFERLHPRPLDRVRRPIATARALADPRAAYFERLAALSHGNPRQALYYWRASVRATDSTPKIRVRSLPPTHHPLVRHVALSQRIILALLVQHGSLTAPDLAAMTLESTGTVDSDLHVLRASGLVALRDAMQWTVGPVVAHPLTLELRAENLI